MKIGKLITKQQVIIQLGEAHQILKDTLSQIPEDDLDSVSITDAGEFESLFKANKYWARKKGVKS